jgi:hypothetical protein
MPTDKVSVTTFQCDPQLPCEVIPDIVQLWMISLRREVGVALLRLAIKDGGGFSLPHRETPDQGRKSRPHCLAAV